MALSRLTIDADDTVPVGLRGTWSDDTTALRFDPVDFVGRLAALVPPRRAQLVRYHGVLVPAARWRSRVVPPRPNPPNRCVALEPRRPSTRRWRPGAELLRRTFRRDPQTCPRRGHTMRQLAIVRAGAAGGLTWIVVQGDLLACLPDATADPGQGA